MLLVGDKSLGKERISEALGFQVGGWRFVVARVTGESHRKRGEVCDDFWAIASRDDATAMVVADGAGSAALGQEGAQEVTSALARDLPAPDVARLVASGAESEFRAAVQATLERVRRDLAQRHPNRTPEAALRLYAATLIGFVAAGDRVMSFQIGDGFGACVDSLPSPDRHDAPFATFVSGPENGTYANETFFFTQDHFADRLRIGHIQSPRTILAMTDGITSFACTKGYGDLQPTFWTPILNYLDARSEVDTAAAVTQQLASQAVADLSDDDRTLVIMQRMNWDTTKQ